MCAKSRSLGAGRARRRSARPGRRDRRPRRRAPAPAGRSPARADEPAERGHLLDDAGVVLDVRGGGHERSQLGDARLSTRGLELATLVELVDERDRVDRFALRPQGERGAIHLRVALAVEVARIEDLADRPDGDGESSIEPRTDSSASRFCGGTTALSRSPARSRRTRDASARLTGCSPRRSQAVGEGRVHWARPCRSIRIAGRTEHTFPGYPRRRIDLLDRRRRSCPPGNTRSRARSSAGSPHALWRSVEEASSPRPRPRAGAAGARGRARRSAVRWRPSSRNHGFPRLYAFQSATTRSSCQRLPALRMRAFDCA